MIVRVFRAAIVESLAEEFEEKFLSVSIPLTRAQPGVVDVRVGRPVSDVCEYAMLSTWDDERSIKAFVGEDWDQGFIPKGMEKYIRQCWVHHYELFD